MMHPRASAVLAIWGLSLAAGPRGFSFPAAAMAMQDNLTDLIDDEGVSGIFPSEAEVIARTGFVASDLAGLSEAELVDAPL